ncbi:hypothetical protein RISK_006713 [Rhodopirellula islandica]|uniref:Uncharacterized protein n=1 Tax=Rhodopirellula islandica TaxID=595434 RepID=A0A0J1E6R0_RHOIS|nr:hypothetical protein RISK_006713 [Rhodopirellula islandica]
MALWFSVVALTADCLPALPDAQRLLRFASLLCLQCSQAGTRSLPQSFRYR